MTTPANALDRLLTQPKKWSALTETQLTELLSWGCATYVGVNDDIRSEYLHRLYAHAVKTLTPAARARVVVGLMRPLEQMAREEGWGHPAAMVPFLKLDPDVVVVSTAALQAAQLMEPRNGDPLTGPREVLELTLETADPDTQAAMLGGLADLGDRRVYDLLEAHWHRVSRDAHHGFLRAVACQWPTVAGIEFLIGRLERSTGEERGRLIVSIAETLIRMARSAAAIDEARPFAGAGVADIERVFPSWAVQPDQSPIVVRATYTVAEMGSRILPRLERLAAAESYPKVLPLALRAWAGEDDAIVVDRFTSHSTS